MVFGRTLAVEITISPRLKAVNLNDLEVVGTAILTWSRENFLTDLAVTIRDFRAPRVAAIMDHGYSDLDSSMLAYSILTEMAPGEDPSAICRRFDQLVSDVCIAARMAGNFIGSPRIFDKEIFRVSVDHYEDDSKIRNFGYVGLDWPEFP